MSNTLATLNGTLIARRILTTLLEEFPLLRLITADFSPETALYNQAIKVQLPSAFASATDYHVDNGYVARDAEQTEVTLTINKHKHVTYGFNDQERSSTDVLLVERWARNGAHALGKAMMDDLMALVTVSNFPNETILSSTPNRGDIIAAGTALNGRNVPGIGRFAVLNSTAYGALCQDTTLVANAGSPAETVRSGQLTDVHGFRTLEYAQLTAGSEFRAGFAGVPEALLIATRVPVLPEDKARGGGSVEIVTEPNTNLSIQVRSWYDYALGKEFRTFTIMYGVAVGQAACLERLVTQANE